MKINADLHIHGKHSQGVSPKMEIPVIARESRKKGLDVVGTGDILNPKWMKHVRKQTDGTGLRKNNDIHFLLTAEVEDRNRVHHVLVFPSMSSVENAYSDFKQLSNDIRREGRPRINASGEKIVKMAKKHDALAGPAHAFTPYTGMYSKHDSIKNCYGEYTEEIDFLELGLSADSKMASKISELEKLFFLSNSDAHSPWPYRIGREFNQFEIDNLNYSSIVKAITKGPEVNVGLDPREGKYHRTACNSCYKKYSLEEAEKISWKCECGSTIKKGVKNRVEELSDRPENLDLNYQYLPPLSNIIQKIVGHSSPNTKTVQKRWEKLNKAFGTEINILLHEEISKLRRVDPEVASAIQKFRNKEYSYEEGGGGKYGEIKI